ncbi:DNA-directed RNA polymerase subunit RPC12/RpoP [Enterococcus sp. PF1-24]|uniref:hypothetical protein n=1 Tax=unclassified Enterococcus TaxID=2608891 RepID=UPI00247307CF|nr:MULTISPECIES: hypothetical protein [unclassified Enterococcus]MDH6365476.1 DNA-directed RNA polymerase subunit RPC12/RpoP [Enterococcus sp. PFB1-1]MDH6402570.1 DNA-directed RNA polymerase subunit RPC12/RpoP [Enterococcus sp. PF1-24]
MKTSFSQRLLSLYSNYQNFMKGRYGFFDSLNKTLFVTSLILWLFRGVLFSELLVTVIYFVLLGIVVYRMLSKKIYVRSNENQKFLKATAKIRQFLANFSLAKRKTQGKKQTKSQANIQYVVFSCSHCGQSLRAPQGKGKIKVTCQKCQHTFVKEV